MRHLTGIVALATLCALALGGPALAQESAEALAKAANGGPIKRPSDGKEVKAVAFVQNVGQNSTQ